MATLDTFLPLLSCPDTKKKLQIGTDLLSYLTIEDNSLDCENISAFIDSIIHWLSNSNFKVVQNGLEILQHLSIRMKDELKPYLSSILGPTIDRLGDSKECVREQAKILLIKLMSFVSNPQIILEKLISAFSHKNSKVREEICIFFQECLLRYGVVGITNGQLYVSKFILPLVNLTSDPNSQVRDTSMATLVEIYKHVGDKLRNEILRKHSTIMQQQKLQTLLNKFDEIANTGEAISLNNNTNINNNGTNGKIVHKNRSNLSNNAVTSNHNDEVDFKKVNSFKRATSAPPVKRNPLLSKLPPSSSNSKSSGAADEEMFMNAFEDVPRIQIFSYKELEQEINRIRDTCSNSNMEWEKRIECLRKFRSLLIAGAADYEEFYSFLKPLEVPFQTSVKDLRSQVVREACISIAYLSQRIGNKCDRFAEALLPTLIDSIQNSAKIMSSSAVVAIRFVIQHTHTSRLIPILTYNISSKSKEIRKACCEFLDQLLHTWPQNSLEKHVGALQEAIKKGISDADPEARALARKAFWGFADKFKSESDYLLSSLDSNKQRMLQGEQMSNWSSTNSLNKVPTHSRPLYSRTNSVSTNGSIESINRHCNLLKRSAIPISSTKANSSPRTPVKATSAIDIDAQRRARSKANVYLNQPKCFLNSVHSLSNTKKNEPIMSCVDRGSTKKSRVSKSQPGSRSASPSSRINSCGTVGAYSASANKNKRTNMTSRDQSPARIHRFERKLSSSSTASRSKNYLTSSDLDLSNRMLQQSDEQIIQNAFANQLHVTPRKKYFIHDDQSDESETSSICSDTSFANYGNRKWDDIPKILDNLSSTHWSDRKDGLLGLNYLLESGERLNSFQLKRITDIFTRMLVDPHTKAFSLFLTTLNQLIQIYKNDLNSWLYILMTRLFLKVGSDTLGSIQTRILKTFESIRESFPIDHQFNVIMRLLSDQTQTLNTKVKIAVLQYLNKLIFRMDSSEFTYNRHNNHDIQTALVKIVSWTADIKSSDLRKISQETIVDLYNLNSAEMNPYLNGLRKNYQDAAFQIIQHKQKSRLSQSPMNTPYMVKSISSVHNKNFFDGNENLNPADIYDSLKKTSDEIQKYSFSLDSENLSPNISNGTSHLGSYNNIKDSPTEELPTDYQNVYESLLQQISVEKCNKTKSLLLRSMGEMLLKVNKCSFENHAESTYSLLMGIVSKDEDKEVVKTAEETGNCAVYNFDPLTTFKTLHPYMNHEDSSLNIISIKLLTKMIEINKKEFVTELLPELMPPLLQAYDNKVSAVRKTAVFCMVAISGSVGDAMKPYTSSLSGSKMKLLDLYIDRSKKTNNGTTVNSQS